MLENTQLLFTLTSIIVLLMFAIYILLLVNELKGHWNKKLSHYITVLSLLPFGLLFFIEEPSQTTTMFAFLVIYIVTQILIRYILKRETT